MRVLAGCTRWIHGGGRPIFILITKKTRAESSSTIFNQEQNTENRTADRARRPHTSTAEATVLYGLSRSREKLMPRMPLCGGTPVAARRTPKITPDSYFTALPSRSEMCDCILHLQDLTIRLYWRRMCHLRTPDSAISAIRIQGTSVHGVWQWPREAEGERDGRGMAWQTHGQTVHLYTELCDHARRSALSLLVCCTGVSTGARQLCRVAARTL
jgi:hypothetical protein